MGHACWISKPACIRVHVSMPTAMQHAKMRTYTLKQACSRKPRLGKYRTQQTTETHTHTHKHTPSMGDLMILKSIAESSRVAQKCTLTMVAGIFVLVQNNSNAKKESYCCTGNLIDCTKFTTTNEDSKKMYLLCFVLPEKSLV